MARLEWFRRFWLKESKDLETTAIISGLISIITPTTFLSLIILLIAVSKTKPSKKARIGFVFSFGGSIVLFYIFLGYWLIDIKVETLDKVANAAHIKYFFSILNLSIGLWLIGVINKTSKAVENNRIFKSFIWVMLSIIFMASSLASAGPILDMLLLGQPNSMLISFFYGLGLTIPVGFLLCLTCKFTAKILIKARHKQTFNLYGGLFESCNGGLPMVDNEGNETTNIHGVTTDWEKWLTK